jgi:hypothetical protein
MLAACRQRWEQRAGALRVPHHAPADVRPGASGGRLLLRGLRHQQVSRRHSCYLRLAPSDMLGAGSAGAGSQLQEAQELCGCLWPRAAAWAPYTCRCDQAAKSVSRWLEEHDTSPLTNARLPHKVQRKSAIMVTQNLNSDPKLYIV